MSRKAVIAEELNKTFTPLHLQVDDESHMHSVPDGAESHFRVTIVSERFREQRLLDRQRWVNKVLEGELRSGMHALALHTWTPEEWFEKGGQVPPSPPCLGGSKAT
jgi:BolA protein